MERDGHCLGRLGGVEAANEILRAHAPPPPPTAEELEKSRLLEELKLLEEEGLRVEKQQQREAAALERKAGVLEDKRHAIEEARYAEYTEKRGRRRQETNDRLVERGFR